MHSGLQFGGDPVNSGRHEHDGVSPFTWHCEFGPQGDGTHGLPAGSGNATVNRRILIKLHTSLSNYKSKIYIYILNV